jgi:N6-adenosine-specific RNA methylase IME4
MDRAWFTRVNPEQCLLGTRGSPRWVGKDVRKLVIDRRREHSRKPDQVRERIERLVSGPYLELFARETKRGWDCWGDQIALFKYFDFAFFCHFDCSRMGLHLSEGRPWS